MKIYRLDITHKGKPAGQLEIKGEDGWELARILHNTVENPCDWEFIWLESEAEKRILESSPEGIKVISSERIYNPCKPNKTQVDYSKS